MKYRGRNIDPVRLWSNYCDFPANMLDEETEMFLPKVICPNPDHNTEKRHFQVNAAEGLVHCFAACGISGTFEHAVCVVEGLYEKYKVSEATDERERKRRTDRAKREAGKIILRHSTGLAKFDARPKAKKKRRIYNSAANVVSPELLSYEGFLPPVAQAYLAEREISAESISAWNIGWLPDEKRIAIPGRDENGKLRLLIKRAIWAKQQPKYLYTEGFPKTELLFGACQLDLQMVESRGITLVEGSIDVIRLHQNGIRNAVAILGTGISESQRRIIARMRPKKIYLLFDRDSAGIHNIEIAADRLRKYPLYVVKYPKGKSDPAELTKKEVERQIERAESIRSFNNRLNVQSKKRERISVG